MKIAIVHDWLTVYAGAERVLEEMLRVYPEADLFSLIDFVPKGERGFLGGRRARTSFLQHLPAARSHYRRYLPLMPFAIRQLDLAGYDLVLSNSHAFAKSVVTGPSQLHVCMCHTPLRYVWDLREQYLKDTGLDRGITGLAARWLLRRLRQWDAQTARDVDVFLANSHHIAERIRRAYQREAAVLYPPVDVEAFTPGGARDDFYVTASRLVPYKRIDLIVEAFAAMPSRRLVVIGDGPEAGRIRKHATSNVQFLGHQPFEVLRDYLRRSRAFIFAAEEDFGIAPLEAQACGTPVIALAKGGAVETIRGLEHAEPTGVFFPEPTPRALQEALSLFERHQPPISALACRTNALRFHPERFRQELRNLVGDSWERFSRGTAPMQTKPLVVTR
jgi:glycosyltransferase involved in cell wall biosynthesis